MTIDVKALLKEFKRKESARSAQERAHRKAEIEQRRQKKKKAWSDLKNKLMPAKKSDYDHWITGYIGNGKMPTHYYEYPFSLRTQEFYIAHSDFTMFPLCGSSSIIIIVPSGVKYLGGELGHCTLLFEDGYDVKGLMSYVPVFLDTEAE